MNIDFLMRFLEYFSRALLLLLVLPLSSAAQGLVAKWQGDDTAEREGRITLNPFVHLDLMGSMMMLLIGFGWTKPLPISYHRFRNFRKGIILTSLAGPVANLLAALLCSLIYDIMACFEFVQAASASNEITPVFCIALILGFLFRLNICMAVIHLLPLPPMSGFNILRCFTGNKFERWYFMNQQKIHFGSMIILVILFTLPPEISPLHMLIDLVCYLVGSLTSWIPKVVLGV